MEKVKDVLAVVGAVLVFSFIIFVLVNMEIEIKPFNSKEFHMFMGSITVWIIAHFSFKRVDKLFSRKINKKSNK